MRLKNYVVETTAAKDMQRRVSLRHEGARGQLVLMLPRYSLVGPNDQVYLSAGHPQQVSIISSENAEDLITVVPTFEHVGKVTLGSFQITYQVVEPHRADDFHAL